VVAGERSLRRYRRHSLRAGTADLIAHEQLHCVIVQLARSAEGIYGEPLVEAVEEGCVELLSFLVSSGDPRWRLEQPRFAQWCQGSPYAQQRCAITEVLGGRPSAATAARAFALAQANVRGGTDATTVRLLNKLSGRRLSAVQRLKLVGSIGCVPQPAALHMR
jgi:hypothetical protein